LVKKWKSYQSGGRSHSPKPTACITEFQRTEFLEKCKGFTFLPEDENGIYGYRNRIGIWGAWVTHLGILVLILGFIITQTCSYQSYLYGTETTIRQLENTDYQVHIDAFTVTYRDDYTVDSYTTELSVLDENGVVLSKGSTSVNHPFVYKGYRFYQNSTGYACTLELFENDEFQNSEEIYAGTSVSIEALDVTIALNNLYPDYQMENGQPQTISPYLNNPYALYTLYYNDNILDMNVAAMGERLKFGVIEADFTDPKQYSMLEVRKDPALSVVLAGAILIMIGLFLSFYFRTEEIWIQKLRKDAPEDTNALEDTLENKMQWGIFCYSSKAQLLLEEKISDLLSDKEETNESE
jgi:cytochrome c biogenesis protein